MKLSTNIIYNIVLAVLAIVFLMNQLNNLFKANPEPDQKQLVKEISIEKEKVDFLSKELGAKKVTDSLLGMFFFESPFLQSDSEFIATVNATDFGAYSVSDSSLIELKQVFATVGIQQAQKSSIVIDYKKGGVLKKKHPDIIFLDIILAMGLAGLLGAVLANLRGFFEYMREAGKFPDNLLIPYLLRPITGGLSGVLVFFLANTLVSSAASSYESQFVTYKGTISFLAFAILAGFASQEFTERLKAAAAALFGTPPKAIPPVPGGGNAGNGGGNGKADKGDPPATPPTDPPPPDDSPAPPTMPPPVSQSNFGGYRTMNRD